MGSKLQLETERFSLNTCLPPYGPARLRWFAMAKSDAKRILWLDSVRGIAALCVVYHHVIAGLTIGPLTFPGRPFFGLLNVGRFGVIVFFAISGYIITQTLSADAYNRATVARFVTNRVFRLYPAYWLSLALACMLASFPMAHILLNVTMLQRFFGQRDVIAPYWTLQIEIVFYVLCALIFVSGFINNPKAPFVLCRVLLVLAFVLAVARFITGVRLPVGLPLPLSVMFIGFAWRVARGSAKFWILLIQFEVALLLICLFAYTTTAINDENWLQYFIFYTMGVLVFLALSHWQINWQVLSFLGHNKLFSLLVSRADLSLARRAQGRWEFCRKSSASRSA